MPTQHVRPLRKSQAIVHAVLGDGETWCGWQYITNGMLDGRQVPIAASDPGPLTCKKCANRMKMVVHQRMTHDLNAAGVEQLMELSTKLVVEPKSRFVSAKAQAQADEALDVLRKRLSNGNATGA